MSKYRCLISAQPRGQEIIQDLYKEEMDHQKGIVHGGMIRQVKTNAVAEAISHAILNFDVLFLFPRELLVAFHHTTGQWPQSIIFYRFLIVY